MDAAAGGGGGKGAEPGAALLRGANQTHPLFVALLPKQRAGVKRRVLPCWRNVVAASQRTFPGSDLCHG